MALCACGSQGNEGTREVFGTLLSLVELDLVAR